MATYNTVITNVSGSVGIGTTNVTSRLLVLGNSSNLGEQIATFKPNGSQTGGAGVLDVQNSGGSSILFVTGSGNVGIGSSSPAVKLDVAGAIRGTTFASDRFGLNVNPINTASTSQSFIRFQSTGGDFYVGTESSTGGAFFPGSTAYSAVLYNGSSTPIHFYTGASLKATITSAGRVGIGLTDPSALLANTNTTDGMATANSSGIQWKSTANDWAAVIISRPASGNNYGLRVHGGDGTTSSDYPFWVSSGTTTGTARLVVRGDGNVGVGQTNPGNLFTVNQASNTSGGTATSYGFMLNNQGTARLSIGNDGTNTLIQSWSSNPLVINAQGNNISLGGSAAGPNTAVGVGTPNARLHVQGSTTTTTPTLLVRENQAMANATAAFDVQNSSSTSLFFVSGSGNVGIGISTPGVRLDVFAGGNTAARFVSNLANTSPVLNAEPGIILYTQNSTAGNYMSITNRDASYNANAQMNFINVNHTGDSAINFVTRTGATIGERLRITAAGNVGIGVTSPPSLLSIDSASSHTTNDLVFTFDSAGNYRNGISNNMNSGDLDGNKMMFNVCNTSTTVSNLIMTLTGRGRVGIGDTAPAYKLVVSNGDTSQTGAMFINAAVNSTGKGLVISSNTRTSADNAVLALEVINRTNGNTLAATVAGDVGIGITNPSSRLHVAGGDIRFDSTYGIIGATNTAGNVLRADGTRFVPAQLSYSDLSTTNMPVRTVSYTSITGASGDWYPLFKFGATDTTGAVVCTLSTASHSSVTFAVNRGWPGSNFYSISVLNCVLNPNGGFPAVTEIRVIADSAGTYDAQVEVKLVWSSGPTTNVTASVMASPMNVVFAASLATTAAGSASPGVSDSVVLSNNMMRAKGNIIAGGNVGIGTSSPAVKLHVGDQTTTAQTTVRIGGGGGDKAPVLSLFNAGSREGYVAQSTTNLYIGNTGGLASYADSTLASNAGITVNTSNSVGIGTTSPGTLLDVYGTSNPRVRVSSGAATAPGFSILQSGQTGWTMYQPGSSSDLRFAQASDYITFQNGGNVGIGTTNPSGVLEVRQTNNAGRTNVTFINPATASTSNRMRLRIAASGGYNGTDLHPYMEAYEENAGNAANGLAFGTYNGSALGERARFDASGRLLVGLTSSNQTTSLLQVSADSSGGLGGEVVIRNGAADASENLARLTFKVSSNYTSGVDSGRIEAYRSSSGANLSGLRFWTYGGAGIAQAMVIDQLQNVGIGTTNPRTKTHVWTTSTGANVELARYTSTYAAMGDGPLVRFTNVHPSGLVPNAGEYNLAGIRAYDYNSSWGGALQFLTAVSTGNGGALTAAMTISTTQDVGIGTATTAARLHVIGSSTAATPTMIVREGVASPTNGALAFEVERSTGATILAVSGSGFVGVGTSNPAGTFEVVGVSGSLLLVTDNLSGSLFSVNDVTGLPILEVFSDDTLIAGRVNTNALVVTGSSVGIGTSNTNGNRLAVNGQASITGSVLPGADNTYDLGSSSPQYRWRTLHAVNISGSLTPTGATAGSVFFAGVSGQIAQDNANFFWDDANNRLGIGTATPAATLDVAGTIQVTTSIVPLWAVATNGSLRFREFGSTAANNTLELNVRPSSGKSGYVTFTEDAVADRWSVGIANGNGNLRFISGTPTAGSLRASLESTGNWIPGADNSQNLGSSGLRWNTLHATNISGSLTPTGATAGSVFFAGVSGQIQQDNASFFWDDTNNRLGIGTNSASNTLDVNGTVRVRSVSNATGNFATYSGTGVLQQRTAAEVKTDLSLNNVQNLSVSQIFNNTGAVHGTRSDFANITDFGYQYVQGSTNGPNLNSATQYYAWTIGLGSEYPYTNYGAQFAIPRAVANPYMGVRYREATTWSSWHKLAAGNADILTTARTLWGQSFDGSGNVTGNLTSVGNITGNSGITLTAAGTLSLVASGANVITATTNGTEALRIDSSQNVGIGTATAGTRLHVYSGATDEVSRFESTGNPYISLYDTGVRQGYLYSNTSSVELVAENSKPLYLQGATEIRLRTNTTTDRVIINSGGVVGINYTPPVTTAVTKLMVSGDIGMPKANAALLGNLYYDTAVPGWKYGANGYGWGFREDNAGLLQMVRAGNNTSGANAAASISLTDLFTFDLVNNRVGLGTGSPSTKFHVLHSSNDPVMIEQTTDAARNRIYFKKPTRSWTLGPDNSTGTNNLFVLADETAGAYRVTVDTSGNVGINTSSMSRKLVVHGSDALINDITIGRGGLSPSATSVTNTVLGNSTFGQATSSQTGNVAIGYLALNNATTGADGNVAMGALALNANTTAKGNVGIGYYAMSTITTASGSVAVGYEALKLATGADNTAVGWWAGKSISTATGNVAVGSNALATATTSGGSTAVGAFALYNNTSPYNTAVGYGAGVTVSTGLYNTSLGAFAGGSISSQSNSTAVGYSALVNATGAGNSAFGYNAGSAITSSTKNLILGGYTGNAGGLDIRTSTASINSNNIILSDGDGNIRARFDFRGAVGVGTTTAVDGYAMHVVTGSTNANTRMLVQSTGTEKAAGYWTWSRTADFGYFEGDSNGNFKIGSFTSNRLDLVTNNTVALTVDTSQNVGIGTVSTGGEALRVYRSSGCTLGIYSNTSNATLGVSGYQTTTPVTAALEVSSTAASVGTATSHPLRIVTVSGERMRIDTTGKVGIGTTNPTATLSVMCGATQARINAVYTDYAGIFLNGSTTDNDYNFLSNASGSDKNLYINRPDGWDIRFRKNNGDQVTITSAGRVGIGTATPDLGFLHVNGVITNAVLAFSFGWLRNQATASGRDTFTFGTTVNCSIYGSDRIITGTEFNALSDYRTKNVQRNIESEEGLRFIEQVNPVIYTWKSDERKELKYGFIAQDVLKAGFGPLVGIQADEKIEEYTDEEGFTSPKGGRFIMCYDNIVPLLSAAMRGLKQENDSLKSEIQSLKDQISSILEMLNNK